jgi:NADH-quinone oxidoreductase subunit A
MIENKILDAYLAIFIFIAIAVLISLIILILPRLLAKFKPGRSKLSSYECGFDPISDSHNKFDIKFYLIAILFIIFDLEVAFLIPWAVRFKHLSSLSFWSMMFFILILAIGFVYEWKKEALELG